MKKEIHLVMVLIFSACFFAFSLSLESWLSMSSIYRKKKLGYDIIEKFNLSKIFCNYLVIYFKLRRLCYKYSYISVA